MDIFALTIAVSLILFILIGNYVGKTSNSWMTIL